MPVPHYNYSFMLPGESLVDKQFGIDATGLAERWYPAAFAICLLYMAGIYWGQRVMAGRAAFDLRRPLIGWNIFLSAFSIAGAVRNSPDFFATLWAEGYMHSVCVSDYVYYVTGWWSMLFTISKVFELGDTAFLVLRKRPVIFLHWYHHVSVLLFSWHGFNEMAGPGRWFIAMNYIVHAVMYPYYLARALGVRVPRWVPVSITLMQLGQMFAGCGVCGTVLYLRLSGSRRACQMSRENLTIAVLVYASYLILFLNFFYHAYIARKPRKSASKENSGKDENPKSADIVANGGPVKGADNLIYANGTGEMGKMDADSLRQRSKKNGYHPDVYSNGDLQHHSFGVEQNGHVFDGDNKKKY